MNSCVTLIQKMKSDLLLLPENGMHLNQFIEAIEKCLIAQALQRTKGSRVHAAFLLGLKRTTLVEKMRRYGFPLHGPHGKKLDS